MEGEVEITLICKAYINDLSLRSYPCLLQTRNRYLCWSVIPWFNYIKPLSHYVIGDAILDNNSQYSIPGIAGEGYIFPPTPSLSDQVIENPRLLMFVIILVT